MTYGHHVKANYAPNREFYNFPPFLIVVLQHRHQIQNLCKILIYLKKRSPKADRFYCFYGAISLEVLPTYSFWEKFSKSSGMP